MVFGIVSLAGLVTCVVPILSRRSPGSSAPRRSRRSTPTPAAYSGRSEANAGKIMGIVGTCLLVLVLLGIVALIIIGVNGGFDDDPYDDPYYSDTFIGGLR